MNKNRGVAPILAVLLLVGLTVGIVTLYTTVATSLITLDSGEEYKVPNVAVDDENGEISARLLDDGDMESVAIRTPEKSSLDDIYLRDVGSSTSFTITENDTGQYRLVGLDDDGEEVLIENIQVGKSASDSVSDLELLVLEGDVQGGENSISFDLRNTGDEEVSLTKFRVDRVNLDHLTIDTETRPSSKGNGKGSGKVDEVRIESTPSDGKCGVPKPKQLPIDEPERFENCQAGSEPSVTGSGLTMEVTFNGVQASKDTDFIGLSPEPRYTDMAISMFGAKGEKIRIPLTLDTFVIPKKTNDKIYNNQLTNSSFEEPPSTILARENTVIKKQIKNIKATSVYLSDGTVVEDEIEKAKAVTGGSNVTVQDDLDTYSGDVYLGSNSEVSYVATINSFQIGFNSTVTGEIEDVDNDVIIGRESVTKDVIENIDGDVVLREGTVTKQSGIKSVDQDVILHDNVKIDGPVQSISGEVICGDNVEIKTGSCDSSL